MVLTTILTLVVVRIVQPDGRFREHTKALQPLPAKLFPNTVMVLPAYTLLGLIASDTDI